MVHCLRNAAIYLHVLVSVSDLYWTCHSQKANSHFPTYYCFVHNCLNRTKLWNLLLVHIFRIYILPLVDYKHWDSLAFFPLLTCYTFVVAGWIYTVSVGHVPSQFISKTWNRTKSSHALTKDYSFVYSEQCVHTYLSYKIVLIPLLVPIALKLNI